MITPGQAEQIVKDCIREVATTSEAYKANKRLGQFSIIADVVVRAFAREVRENTSVGVKAFSHTLAAKELMEIDSETTAGDVERIVATKSVRAAEPPNMLAMTASAKPTGKKGTSEAKSKTAKK